MPWRIVKSQYDPQDLTTLHDDEMIAIEEALRGAAAGLSNETNPAWRAWRKIRPLAEACTGDGDPVELLPPGARTSPVWADHQPGPTPRAGASPNTAGR